MKILKSKMDMRTIQYLNIFEKITKIKTKYCFEYNLFIIFAVPGYLVSKAIGENGINVKRISKILNHKVRIVAIPSIHADISNFIETIIYPVKFKKIIIETKSITIKAGPQARALIIGRNRVRLNNLKNILEKYFGIERIIIK
jgi:NusA-like KH domain protein